MRLHHGLALVVAALWCGCYKTTAFVCTTDAQCEAMRCVEGACARPDSTCPSGLRWDDSAGDRAGQCPSTTGADLSGVVVDLAMAPPDLASQPPDLSQPSPLCGNGRLDPSESCDDGPGSPAPCPTAASCDDREPCTNDLVTGAPCQRMCAHTYDNLGDGVACPGTTKPGTCYQHVCCYGCLEAGNCMGGGTLTACGAAGKACSNCNMNVPECRVAMCGPSGCTTAAAVDGTPCPVAGGTCAGGRCCTGCLLPGDGGYTCVLGTDPTACGSAGVACANCGTRGCGVVQGQTGNHCQACVGSCLGKVCGTDGCGVSCGMCGTGTVCSSGLCVCSPTAVKENTDALCGNGLDDDCNGQFDCTDSNCSLHRCGPKANFCVNKACAAGCLVNGTYYPLGPVAGTCYRCDATSDTALVPNDNATCTANGTPGLCHAGACCIGCLQNGICQPGTATAACGSGGGSCNSCTIGCGNGVACNGCANLQCVQLGACIKGTCDTRAPTVLCCGATTCKGSGSAAACQ